MKSLDDFISASLVASKSSQPIDALTALLESTIKQPVWFAEILPETNDDEILLHASTDLTIYSIKLSPGLQFPPHSHGMPAVIGFYEGCETNLIYQQQDNGELIQSERIDFEAPCVGQLDTNIIRAITNFGQETSRAIHFYLGDLINQPRDLWSPDFQESMPFDNSKYFEFAKPNID